MIIILLLLLLLVAFFFNKIPSYLSIFSSYKYNFNFFNSLLSLNNIGPNLTEIRCTKIKVIIK